MGTTVLPSWLDPAAEVKRGDGLESFSFVIGNGSGDVDDWWEGASEEDRMVTAILGCLGVCKPRVLSGSIDLERLFWVIGNVISEQGWFTKRKVLGNNLGGWKINQGHQREWMRRKALGEFPGKPHESPPWFRDAGHVASGDDPEVYYRVFGSVDEFFGEWLERFVPRPGTVGVDHRYYKTGREFWNGRMDETNGWFLELCLAGYKGPVTQAAPEKSVRNFWRIVQRLKNIVAQALLNRWLAAESSSTPKLKCDGDWGEKSRKVAEKFIARENAGGGKRIGDCQEKPSDELLEALVSRMVGIVGG